MKKMKYHVVCFCDDSQILEFDSYSRNVRRHFLETFEKISGLYCVDVFEKKTGSLLSKAYLTDEVLLVGTPFTR